MEFDECNHVVIPLNRHLHSNEAKHKCESNFHSPKFLDHDNGLVDIPTPDQYVDSTYDHNPLDPISDYEYHYLDDTYNCATYNDQSSDNIDEFRDGLCDDYLAMMNDHGFDTLSPPLNFVDESVVIHITTSGGATPASSTDRVADDDWSEYDWGDLVQPIQDKESPSTPPSPTENQANRKPRNASKALSGLTPKKPRKERGPKLAFKMEIDVDVIDDGYKWRKYGQKAVKNSPYPRGYYKCTSKHCNVKKHVERQLHEPKFVITTYEGVHNHLPPDQQLQGLPISSCFAQYPEDAFHFLNNYKRQLRAMDLIYHT